MVLKLVRGCPKRTADLKMCFQLSFTFLFKWYWKVITLYSTFVFRFHEPSLNIAGVCFTLPQHLFMERGRRGSKAKDPAFLTYIITLAFHAQTSLVLKGGKGNHTCFRKHFCLFTSKYYPSTTSKALHALNKGISNPLSGWANDMHCRSVVISFLLSPFSVFREWVGDSLKWRDYQGGTIVEKYEKSIIGWLKLVLDTSY